MGCTFFFAASHFLLLLLLFLFVHQHECQSCSFTIYSACSSPESRPGDFAICENYHNCTEQSNSQTNNQTIVLKNPDGPRADDDELVFVCANSRPTPLLGKTPCSSNAFMGCNHGGHNGGTDFYPCTPEGCPPMLVLLGCIACQQFSSPSKFYSPDEYNQVHRQFWVDAHSCPGQGSSSRPWKLLFTIICPVLALVLLLFLAVYWIRRGNKQGLKTSPSRIMRCLTRTTSYYPETENTNGVTVFSYAELQEATNNFDDTKELGEGGFGIVYHGKLRDGREVAVKRMYEKNFTQIEQFKNEIRILTTLRHPNLVTLYGCGSRHCRELLLVYDYIPNKTVAEHLHGDKASSALLLWPARMSIAVQTATALSYLHFNEVIHRDIKTDNILLDHGFRAKVADFGLSRLFPADVSHVSTAPQGTPGYVDPEYHQCYHLTDRSDVYSFGVVLVELVSSLPAVDLGRHRHEVNLAHYAMNRIQCSRFGELVDPRLGFERDFKVRRMTTLVAELAFRCLQEERELRPSMTEVLEELQRLESADYDALEAEETQ